MNTPFRLCVFQFFFFIFSARTFDDPHSVFIEVSPGENLSSIVWDASSGTSILLNDGAYGIGGTVQFRTDDVTIRSKSGDRDAVILDGNQGGMPLLSDNFLDEIVQVSASHIVIADLTIRYARHHPIHVSPPAGGPISNILMSNIHVYDGGQQLIKVNSNGADPLFWADSGVLENSLIEFIDNSVMEYWPEDDVYYTGGVDVHGGWNWIIRNNLFRNIQRNATMMEHAVHMWNKCRGTLIENNRFEDCYRAVGLGMDTSAGDNERHYPDGAGDDPYFDHIGGMVRNNVVFNRAGIHLESGIELMNVIDVEVYHNTVISHDPPFSSIEYRWPNTRVILKNNCVSHSIKPRDEAGAAAVANIENAPPALFTDHNNGDLHLSGTAAAAIDQGVVLEAGKAGVDIDGEVRGAVPDIGADEWSENAVAFTTGKHPSSRGIRVAYDPASRAFIISGAGSAVKINVYDLRGRSPVCRTLRRGDRIVFTSLTPGVYLVRVQAAGGVSAGRSIVVPE